jgi:uncharacterized protein
LNVNAESAKLNAVPWPVVLATSSLVLLLFVSVGALLQHLDRAIGLALTEGAIFFGVPFLVRKRLAGHGVSTSSFGSFRLMPVLFGAALGLFNALAFVAPLMAAATRLFSKAMVEQYDVTRTFSQLPDTKLFAVLAVACVLAPLCEEYFFRGFILPALVVELGQWLAIVACATFFALMHFNPVNALALFELGLLFSWLSLRTKSLWPAIAAHTSSNAWSGLLYLLSRKNIGPRETNLQEVLIVALAGQLFFWALLLLATRTRLLQKTIA